MRLPGSGAGVSRGLACALAVLVASVPGQSPAVAQVEVPRQLTVFIDLVVEDARKQPVRNLTPEEVVISQQAVQQRVATLVPRETPGHYELSYVPASGQAGPVMVQLLRPGARARGLEGPALKPRVVKPLSPLETVLTQVLETRPDADDFPAAATALHFGTSKDGIHHTFVLEVPLSGLVAPGTGGAARRLQVYARVKDDGGRLVRRFELDRSLAATGQEASVKRLVWTGQAPLARGRYVLEAVAHEPATARASVRRVSFEATEPPPGLRMGSVALLQPGGGLLVREGGGEGEDPFHLGGQPLMPTLELQTLAVTGAQVEFFTIVYPDAKSPDPVALKLEVVRDGQVIESAPLPVPPPDARGEIRYVGGIPTRGLDPAPYRLRLQAQQGAMRSQGDVPFTVLGAAEAPPVRVGARPAGGGGAAAARTAAAPEPPEVTAARSFLRRRQYDEALRRLKKADEAYLGGRAEVALYLGVAYNGLGAYKDAEAALRRAFASAKDDPVVRGQATFLLGRVLASGEKKAVNPNSERLRAAEETFRKLLTTPDLPLETPRVALAETLLRLDRAPEARDILDELLRAPDTSDASRDRARQLLTSPRCATERCLPGLSFVTPEGSHQTAEDVRGKAVLLAYWATWCEPCVAALPDLKRIYAVSQKEPFVMVGVNMHDEPNAMKRFVEENRVPWPQISGEAADRLIESMAVTAIPTELLFDHEGVAVSGTVGWRPGDGDSLFRAVGGAVRKAKKEVSARAAPGR